MSDDRLRQLKQASKAWREADRAFQRSLKSNASRFEQVRLAKELQKKSQAHCDLIASMTGVPAAKVPRPPLDFALVPKQK